MKKRFSALLLAAILVIAATVVPASAANYDNIDFSAVKGANCYINSGDNLLICVQGEDGDPGILGRDKVGECYGLILFCDAATTGSIWLVANGRTCGWDQQDMVEPKAYDGGMYYARLDSKSPFTSGEDDYSQYCLCNWAGATVKIVGYALLGKDGNFIATAGTVPATSPLAGAALPKTGVVSAAVLYTIGAALIGGGVLVTRKSKED